MLSCVTQYGASEKCITKFRPSLVTEHCNIQAPIYNIYDNYVAMKKQ
jgi:hypothetical protein